MRRYWFRHRRFAKAPQPSDPVRDYQSRLWTAGVFMLVAFLCLIAQFTHLQVFSYKQYQTQAENNRIQLVPIEPVRGTISDRNGIVLAHNYSTFTLEITPSAVANLNQTIEELGKIIDISPRDIRRFKQALADSRNYTSLPIRTRLTDEEVARFAVQKYRFPGVDIRARLYRQYPFKTTASHAIGYIGRINEKDVEDLKASGEYPFYRGTDHIGKEGIEKEYESVLHGVTGWEQVEVDALGRRVRTLAMTPPTAGSSIELTLDLPLQQLAEYELGDNDGAVVAINPQNGEVLALVSKPGFDPALFVEGIDAENWKILNTDPNRPLLNRAIHGLYPPGSTLKPYLALNALQDGIRKPGDITFDPGFFSIPGVAHRWRDDKPEGHGAVDMLKAIVVSCDTYFFKLGYDSDIDEVHDFLSQFGFGKKTGIDIPGESKGVNPNRAWKWKALAHAKYQSERKWYPGDSISAGIGQGFNSYTPIQIAQAVATLANGGKMYRPHLLRRVFSSITGKPEDVQPEFEHQVKADPAYIEFIRQAMVQVTQHGTAWRAFKGAPYLAGGKTGTAQVYTIAQDVDIKKLKNVPKNLRDHGLFIAFAPADHPTIALAVIVEHGGFGASAAAPVARALLDYWLLHKLPGDKDKPAHAKPSASGATVKTGTGAALKSGSGAPVHARQTPAAAAKKPE